MSDSNLDVSLLMPILVSGIFLGTFGLGMKRMAPLSWELWWFLYSVSGMALIPVLWAWLAVPDLFRILHQPTAQGAIFWGALFGFLWGIGGITFGIAVESAGMSLTYGIVVGLSSAIGSLVPFIRQGGSSAPSAPLFFAALGVMLSGVAICTYAGMRREALLSRSGGRSSLPGKSSGLAVALVSGVMSSLLAIGFDMSAPITGAAASLGIDTPNVSLARWLVVCLGAFAMNAAYSVFLLLRRNSFDTARQRGAGKAAAWALLSGGLWFASFGLSGLAMQKMGRLGLSAGWPILLGTGLVVSTGWSVITREWSGARAPFRVLLGGIAVLIVAIYLLGYARSTAV